MESSDTRAQPRAVWTTAPGQECGCVHAVWGGESHVAQRDVYCLLGIKYKQRLCPDTQLHTSGLVASNGPCVLCFAVIFYGNDRCPT
eukprot:3803195-Rhodomonas_salina.1